MKMRSITNSSKNLAEGFQEQGSFAMAQCTKSQHLPWVNRGRRWNGFPSGSDVKGSPHTTSCEATWSTTFKDALMGMRGSVNYVLKILPAMNFPFLGHNTSVQHTTSILFETQVVKKDGLVKQIVCCSKKKAGRVLYAALIRTTKLFCAISRNT